jgi:hypothetical protein
VGRKNDINSGAMMAVFVVAGLVGILTFNLTNAVITAVALGGLLIAMKVIR